MREPMDVHQPMNKPGGSRLRQTGSLLLLLLMIFLACAPGRDARPDVFLIIIDTLRADHLGCYGYHRDTSPFLDSLATESIRFTNCFTQAPWTLPSHATMWTGLTPKSHMAGMRNAEFFGLSRDLDNIATILGSDGYVTLGFMNVMLLSGTFGFDQGFDHYSCVPYGHGRAGETVDEVIDWLSMNRGNPNPKLVVIHFFDVHSPYDPPQGYDTTFSEIGSAGGTLVHQDSVTDYRDPAYVSHLVDMYDGEIAWVDSQLRRLFAHLSDLGISDNALFIITSDHGEEFMEHGGFGHGHSVYDELVRVPLIICGPGIPAGVVDETPVGLFDILPTVCGYTGTPLPSPVEGLDVLADSVISRNIPISGLTSGRDCTEPDEYYESMCAIVDYPRKGVTSYAGMDRFCFDLVRDPEEMNPFQPDSAMVEALEFYWSTPPVTDPPKVADDNVQDNLRDIGYVR